MIIKRMTLRNFRQFIGEQTIVFSTDAERNVTVLIGRNTAGKTTFVRAFEWILYNDKNGFDDKILLNKNIADRLRVGSSSTVAGALIIEHNGSEYEITRTETYMCYDVGKIRRTQTKADLFELRTDGQTKVKLDSDFDENIERILPNGLSKYFFFGGERIGAITEKKDIEASVKGLMGLDVLSNAQKHLKKVITKFKRNLDVSGNADAEAAQKTITKRTTELKKLASEKENLQNELEYWREEEVRLATELKTNEETAENQKERERKEKLIVTYQERIEKDKKQLVKNFSSEALAFFSTPLLKNALTLLNSKSDDTESVPNMDSVAIDYILNRGICICGTHISPGSAAEHCLLKEKAIQPPEAIGSLVRRYKEQATNYISSSREFVEMLNSDIRSIREDERLLAQAKDDKEVLDKKLANAKDVSIIENNLQAAKRNVRTISSAIEENIGKASICKKEIEEANAQIRRLTKTNEKNKKIYRYISYTEATLSWIADAYKERESSVREKLQDKVNTNFAKLYHGNRSVTIDERYHVKYLDVTTEESDGLKAIKSFAFVTGLVDLAKEALKSENSREADLESQIYPLVMDAPFSNVDEIHITNIAKLVPQSAAQVIIAVMDKDWETAEKTFAPVLGKSYLIEKDVDTDGKPCETITHIKEKRG